MNFLHLFRKQKQKKSRIANASGIYQKQRTAFNRQKTQQNEDWKLFYVQKEDLKEEEEALHEAFHQLFD